jgi:hypothetical protein
MRLTSAASSGAATIIISSILLLADKAWALRKSMGRERSGRKALLLPPPMRRPCPAAAKTAIFMP